MHRLLLPTRKSEGTNEQEEKGQRLNIDAHDDPNLHTTVNLRIRKILHAAAVPEAAAVFTPTGKSLVESKESSSVRMPEFAAVSPNRERGPWKSAGPMPR